MKEEELRECAVCANCEKKIGHTGMPIFHRVSVQTYGLDGHAMQRQTGMEMIMGGHVGLAQVMGANEDLATEIGEKEEFTLCADCWVKELPIASLVESST